MSPTSLSCAAFSGTPAPPFQLLSGAGVTAAPESALDLEAQDAQGCAFAPSQVQLKAQASQSAPAFQAAFSFAFNVDGFGYPTRGFTFILSTAIGCGYRE